jgi:hypothetical protein
MLKHINKLAILAVIAITAGFAYSNDDTGIRRVNDLQIDLWVNKGDDATYYYGDDVAVFFEVNRDAYVIVYDIDPAGNVSLLFPESYDQDCFVRAGQVYRIPGADSDYRLEISGPSGHEYIYAVASYNYIRPPDFIKYAFYDYSDWDRYYDDFVYKQSGSRADFVASLNRRIVDGPYVQASVSFRIDDSYRHSRWYRHWRYEPYYSGSIWIGTDWPGCEVWIDGCYYGITPLLIPDIYIGYHWVWIYHNGYPCWHNHIYINHTHRYYIDAKIDRRDWHRGGHGDAGGGKYDRRDGRGGRKWDLKQDIYRNERDIKTEIAKHPSDNKSPVKQLPPRWVREKYTQKHESDINRDVKSEKGSIDKFRLLNEPNRYEYENKTSDNSISPIKDMRQSTEGNGPRDLKKSYEYETKRSIKNDDDKSEKIVAPTKRSDDSPKQIRQEQKQSSGSSSVKSEAPKQKQGQSRDGGKATDGGKRGKR